MGVADILQQRRGTFRLMRQSRADEFNPSGAANWPGVQGAASVVGNGVAPSNSRGGGA